jgi:hypothetical protein
MSNELVTLSPAQYPALDPNNDRVQLMMQNLGGESLSVADFNRIKIPSQGGTKWQIESAVGTEVVDALDGVILFTTRRRAYWKDPNPSQSPPDCASVDMVNGSGNPGGECEQCPFNAFGTAKNGHGKACKETRVFFLLRPGQVLPDVVAASPGSLKAVRKYLMDLSQVGAPYCAVVTRFGLEKATNADNTAYAKITAKMVGKLDEASYKNILATIKQYQSTFEQVVDDFAEEAGPQEV